ncbi:MAG: CHAT domain-containing protein [Gemmatimonadetes bacterium]|nr:CHAT domain-containing protein [Gemmatimonadota bacterium]
MPRPASSFRLPIWILALTGLSLGAAAGLQGQDQRPLRSRLVHYPVDSLLGQRGDTALGVIRAGSGDGLFEGARGRATNGDRYLGAVTVRLLGPDSAVVQVVMVPGAGLRLERLNLVALPTRLPTPPRAGILTDLMELGIEFVGLSRQDFLPRRQILRLDGDSLERVMLDSMTADIHETADFVRDMFDSTSDLKRVRAAGRYQGRSAFRVMETATPADVRRFLVFVRSWPGKYMGKRWKINETFATWLINDAPFGQDDLRDSLLALPTAAARRPVVLAHAGDIRNNFLTWWNNDAAEAVRGSRLAEARRLSTLAYEVAVVLGDTANQGWSELRRAQLLEAEEKFDEAIAANRAALALFRAAREWQGAGYAADNIGDIQLRLSRGAEGLASYDSAIVAKRAWLGADSTGIALQRLGQSMMGRGRALEKLGRWDDALAALAEAERMFAGASTETAARDEADARARQASIHGNRGDYARAIATYRTTLQFYRDLLDREGEADQLDNIAYNLSRLGEHRAAIALWDTARTLHQQTGNPGDAAYALSQIGQSRWTLGDFPGAIAAHQEAVALRRQAGNRSGAAYSLRKLGALFRDSGDPARGLAYLDSAAVLYHDAQDPAGEAEVRNELGDLYSSQADYPAAIATYRTGLEVQRRLGLTADAAATLYDIGEACYAQERWDCALETYREALALYRQTGDMVGQAKSLSNLGLVAENLRQPAAVVDSFYREGMVLATRSGSKTDIAWLEYAVGRRYRAANALDSAAAAFGRARELYRQVNDAGWTARVDVARGDLATFRGDFRAAATLLNDAAARADSARDRKGLADALSSLSWLATLQGNYAEATRIEERSLALSEEVRNGWGIARSYVGLGNIQNELGDYQEAIRFYHLADSLHAAGNRAEARATPVNNIGTIYFWQRDYEHAIPQFEEALRLLATAGPDADVGDAPATYTTNLGEVYYEQGRYAEAEPKLRSGLALAERAGSVRIASSARTILGKLYAATDRVDDADRELRLADSLVRAAGLRADAAAIATQRGRLAERRGDRPAAGRYYTLAADSARAIGATKLLWEPLFYLGRLQLAQGDSAGALGRLEEATKVLEALRARVVGGQDAQKRFSSGADYDQAYELLVGLLVRRGDVGRALAVLDRSNSEELRSRFRALGVRLSDSTEARTLAQERELKARVDGIEAQIAAVRAAPAAGQQQAQLRALDSIRTIADSQYLSFVYGMAEAQPDLRELASINLTDLPTANAELPRDVALLTYLPGAKELYVFVATTDTVVARVVPIGRDELTRRVEQLVALSRVPGDASLPNRAGAAGQAGPAPTGDPLALAAELYQILVAPALPVIGARPRLAIVPSGALLYLPFQILGTPDGKGGFRRLADERTVFYETDLTIRPAARGPRPAVRLAAFGPADSLLTSAEREVGDLKRLFPTAQVYTRRDANERAAKTLGPQFTVIHFATHGNLDYKRFSDSYLSLYPSADGKEDGRLTITEVLGSTVFRQRRLVVLSACNTAVSSSAVPGWPLSPATAFLKRGADAVLASLWPVDDAATELLITAFYRNLRTMDTATALRQAQQTVKANPKYAHPYYWGAWVLVGDWR